MYQALKILLKISCMVQWPEKLDEKLAKDVKKYNEHFSTGILETRDKFGKNDNFSKQLTFIWHNISYLYV